MHVVRRISEQVTSDHIWSPNDFTLCPFDLKLTSSLYQQRHLHWL